MSSQKTERGENVRKIHYVKPENPSFLLKTLSYLTVFTKTVKKYAGKGSTDFLERLSASCFLLAGVGTRRCCCEAELPSMSKGNRISELQRPDGGI